MHLLKSLSNSVTQVYRQCRLRDIRGRSPKLLAPLVMLMGHKEWIAEVQFLSVVEHPNLVKLIGYCAVDGETGIQRLLVYEYMPNKSLGDHMFNKACVALSWEKRLKIVLGAAQGLAYLHEELEVQVIYRDFKSSNVLLDEDFNPKLSDFGLAREGPTEGNTHVSTAAFVGSRLHVTGGVFRGGREVDGEAASAEELDTAVGVCLDRKGLVTSSRTSKQQTEQEGSHIFMAGTEESCAFKSGSECGWRYGSVFRAKGL